MNPVQRVLAEARARLAAAGIPDAALEAQVLSCHVTGWSKTRLLASFRDPFPEGALHTLKTALLRRTSREPLAYITGHREFFGLDLLVDSRVLVPRQETECLVEQVIAVVKNQFGDRRVTIADLGTGSGAIAIALAKSLPEARIFATDTSAGALDVAAQNIQRHGVDAQVTLRQGDLLEPVPEPVDLVAANLPYIPEGAWGSLQPEVRFFEPKGALLSGEFGLDAVRHLFHQVQSRTRPGWVVLELGDGQAAVVTVMAQALLRKVEAKTYHDLAGLERGVVLRLAV